MAPPSAPALLVLIIVVSPFLLLRECDADLTFIYDDPTDVIATGESEYPSVGRFVL